MDQRRGTIATKPINCLSARKRNYTQGERTNSLVPLANPSLAVLVSFS